MVWKFLRIMELWNSKVEGSHNGMLMLMMWLTVELWYGGTCFIYDYVELMREIRINHSFERIMVKREKCGKQHDMNNVNNVNIYFIYNYIH